MELIFFVLPPLLLLALAAIMVVVSQVSGHNTFVRYSQRQRYSNQMIAAYLQGLQLARQSLSRRNKDLAGVSSRLSRSNEDLENLNRMKTRFLSMAVHDVRSPLATIKGCAQLLADHRLNAEGRKYVQGILLATENVDRLMADLTDLAVIEAGKLRITRGEFSAAGLLQDLVTTLSPLAAQKGVTLTAAVPPDAMAVGDRFRLGQALANLAGNALKFTPAGGRVQIGAASSGAGVLFFVSDSGPGIHPTERRKIFEKFYQSRFADPAAARKGWGLGLAIAAEIVKAHQGEIGVESAGLGKGAQFWFFVPTSVRGPRVRVPRQLLPLAGLLLGLLCAPLRAQQNTSGPALPGIPLDDKARYDRFLEDKADSVLVKMLGPNRAKVVVDATLDFTRTEKFQILKDEKEDEEGNATFAWQGTTKGKAQKELLPGIPVEAGPGDKPAALPPQSYERQFSFPPSFVKKLAVTIVLDRKVTAEQAETVERIVSELLDISQDRGDALTVIRASFAPAWRTIWYSQDSFSMVLKYAILVLMTLSTLIVVGMCFLRLARAIDNMAKAQSQQYALDVGMKSALEEQAGAGEEKPGEPEAVPALPAPEDGDEEVLRIKVKEEQLPTLLEMLRSEDAENVALVSAYLEPAIRARFLKSLSLRQQAEILLQMSSVRFVDPELVYKIKSEIEQRLANAVGGLTRVYALIEAATPAQQAELLKEIEGRDPALYKSVRSRVLLFEDLVRLDANGWSLLISRTSINDWASALREGSPALREAVQGQVLPQTWIILEQLMEGGGATPEKVAKAQADLLEEARKLIAEGRVQSPVGEAAEVAS